MNLYESDSFVTHRYESKADWALHRHELHGVGGSDAAAALGRSKWKSNVVLWGEKTGKVMPKEIKGNARVDFGTAAEEHIRELFKLMYRDIYELQYEPNVILQNKTHPHQLYSPDGLLFRKADGKKGIWECKTTWIVRKEDREKWGHYDTDLKMYVPELPEQYYIQTAHGMNVTDYDFVHLTAMMLTERDGDVTADIIQRTFERTDAGVTEDLQAISEGIDEFYEFVDSGAPPPMKIFTDLI